MTPRERAEGANRLLSDPVMRQAHQDIREILVRKLEALEPNDPMSAELVLKLHLLKDFQTTLMQYVNQETVEKQKLDHDTFIERTVRKARELGLVRQ